LVGIEFTAAQRQWANQHPAVFIISYGAKTKPVAKVLSVILDGIYKEFSPITNSDDHAPSPKNNIIDGYS
jgi:hypothetical protein